MMRTLFLLALLSSFTISLAQTSGTVAKQITIAYEQIQLFNFHSADSILKTQHASGKEGAALDLARANYFWWLIISGEDNKYNRAEYTRLSDKAIRSYKDAAPVTLSDEELYLVITGYANKARIEGLSKNYIKGFGHINTCLKYIQKSFGREKRFIYFTLTSGLYNYYMATANKSYSVLQPYLALFPSGDLNKGIDFLTIASQSDDVPLSTEGHYFLMKLYMDNKDQPNALKHCSWLLKRHPSNLLYSYYEFKLLLDSGKKDQALEVLSSLRLKEMMNTQLSVSQKRYYSGLATQDLKEYYLRGE
jgi:hypothetical protein